MPEAQEPTEQPHETPTMASKGFLERHQAAVWRVAALESGLAAAAWFASGNLPLAVVQGALAGTFAVNATLVS